MLKKKCVFILFFFFCSINSFDFDNIDLKGVVYNPYRVFNLPPWSSMKTIKKRYKELIKKYHPDKSHSNTQEQFQLVQSSFEKIKEARKDHGDDEELSFSSVVKELIKSIVSVELIFCVIYMITSLIYKLQLLFVVPMAFQIISFVLVDNFFPHYFKDQNQEILVAFIGGIILLFVYKTVTWTKKKKAKQN